MLFYYTPNFGLTTFSITTHLPFFSLSYRWRELVAPAHLVPPNLSKTFYNPLLVNTFLFFHRYIPPLKGARGMFLSLFRHYIPSHWGSPRQLGMCKRGGFLRFSVILPPSAYGLRPSISSSFFRLETPFSPFFVSLYYIMSQLFIYPSYTNRPRFV